MDFLIEDALKEQEKFDDQKEQALDEMTSRMKNEKKSAEEILKKSGDLRIISENKKESPQKEPSISEAPEPQQNTPEKSSKKDFVKWFFELDKNSGSVAGGKGANLSEIYNLKVQVPPGFVVTAQAYDYFIETAGIKNKMHELLDNLNYEDTDKLNEVTKQIRAFIEDSEMPKDLEKEISDSYENLDIKDFDGPAGSSSAMDILKTSSEPIFVAVRSSATTEDLADASFAGQQDTYLNIKGKHKLIDSVKRCFASLFTSRATYYRNKKGFAHEKSKLAVVVQKMVDSDKSGVMFSKDPSNRSENIIIEAVWGLGEGIVSGRITPDNYEISRELEVQKEKTAKKKIAITRNAAGEQSIVKLTPERSERKVLEKHELVNLAETAIKLEEHYGKPQDIEFAIEGDEIYIVQTRPITTHLEKNISKDQKRPELQGEVIVEGLAASPGIAAGKVKIIEDLKDLGKIKQGDILVTEMTNPDMVVAMQKSAAVVTNEGGLTAHAAIVSREMGIPSVVGTGDATEKLSDQEMITVDGYSGKIYRGQLAESEKKEIEKVTASTKTHIKLIVDLPTFAERAAKTGLKAIGLTRIEGIIAESGKHPQYFLEKNNPEEYEKIVYNGIKKISNYFDEIWVRTSDIRSNEYRNLEGAPQEKEANPMLGMHGIRYALKNPDILKSELKALKKVSDSGKKVGLIISQLVSLDELKQTKKHIQELGFNDLKVGVMIETPSAVQIIKELCEEGISFISFGTNDLTQYFMAVDRGNDEVQYLFDEMNPGMLQQMEYVIRVCKRNNVETSICGQAGSKKEMAKFLVQAGIDSISVNADKAKEISDYVAELEKSEIQGTDKEPRNYQPGQKQHEQNRQPPNQPNQNSNKNKPQEDNSKQSGLDIY